MITATIPVDQFAELAAKLKAEAGLDLTGNSGAVTSRGVTAAYTYSPSDGKFQIQVTEKPFLLNKGYCEGEIRKALIAHGVACE